MTIQEQIAALTANRIHAVAKELEEDDTIDFDSLWELEYALENNLGNELLPKFLTKLFKT